MSAFGTGIGPGAHQLIMTALAQRGANYDPSSPASQVSPTSPSFSPATADTAEMPVRPMNAMPPMAPQMPAQAPQQPKQELPMTQENIIIQGLLKQLERNHEMK